MRASGEGLKVDVLQPGARQQGLDHLLLEGEALRARELDDAGHLADLAGADPMCISAISRTFIDSCGETVRPSRSTTTATWRAQAPFSSPFPANGISQQLRRSKSRHTCHSRGLLNAGNS